MLAVDRAVRVDIGRVLDLILGKSDREFARDPVRMAQRLRGEQHAAPEQPGGIDDQPARRPVRVVEQQIVHRAERTVGRAQPIALQLVEAP